MIPSGGGLPLAVPALPLPPPPCHPLLTHCSRPVHKCSLCARPRVSRRQAVLGRRRQWRRPLPRQQRCMSTPALDWSAAAIRGRRSLCRGARRASRVCLGVRVGCGGARFSRWRLDWSCLRATVEWSCFQFLSARSQTVPHTVALGLVPMTMFSFFVSYEKCGSCWSPALGHPWPLIIPTKCHRQTDRQRALARAVSWKERT